ncbi:MAG: 4-hydroxy-tetrahydrodipicolinate reductase [Marinilabiliales bacterium]|nr:MAG: 4-hydroxy-tetrahydrodipicolinate reductase [Marinilabiliales bacterium]
MNIAIVGYGKMGKEIERIAQDRGHHIVLKIDENNVNSVISENLKNVDVAIEFSVPQSAFTNISLMLDHKVPVVSGTTGWVDKLDLIIERCKNDKGTFFYASNYSIGVNLFFNLNKKLARLMNHFPDYEISIEETHHSQKIDAPSGTAITLANDLIQAIDHKEEWKKEKAESEESIVIKSYREGTVPGNHKVIYESSFDKITIEHDAKSRKGFAIGAVLAAEFIKDKKGYFTMNELLKI